MRLPVPWPFHRATERIDLGTHAGWAATAVVERRSLGLRTMFAGFGIGRHRPRRVEVRRAGELRVADVPRGVDPWPEALLTIVVVWVACATVLACARWLKG